MDAETDERTYGTGARIIAVVLLIVAAGAAIAGLFEEGPTRLADSVVLPYIAVVLAYGVFSERLETPAVQTAFGIGLTAYGGLLYLETGGILWLGAALVGAILTAHNGRGFFESRR